MGPAPSRHRDLVLAGARPPPGLHRRAGAGRPRRHARRGARGGDPKINPLVPAELVIDHSVQVDSFGQACGQRNAELEFERNRERYAFLRWGQNAVDGFRVVPPATGIVHQVNLEYLAQASCGEGSEGLCRRIRTLVGTDSHTTMINGLGVLGWGVGGIEAEAAMLGQPLFMVTPQVVGFKLHGQLREGITATDLVLCVTQILAQGASSGSSSSSTARASSLPSRIARQSGTWRPSTAPPGLFSDRRGDAELPAPGALQADRAGRGVRRDAEAVPHGRDVPSAHLYRRSSSIWEPSCRARRPGVRRTASRSPTKPAFRACARATGPRGFQDEALEGSFPASEPVATHVPTIWTRPAMFPASGRMRSGTDARARHARGRDRDSRSRLRRDRRDHVVHQHLEPLGADRRRPRGEEGRRARASRSTGVKTSLAPGSQVVTEYLDRGPDLSR